MTRKARRAPKNDASPSPPASSGEGPNRPPPLRVAEQLRTKGRLAEARELCRTILSFEPDNARALFLLGVLEHQMGDSQASVGLIERAIEIDPGFPDAYINLGVALRGLNKLQAAERAIRKGLRLEPDNADGHAILGAVLAHGGHWSAAESAYRRALEINPKHARTFNNLGVLMARQERSAEAEEAYLQALAIRPGYIEARFNLSTVHRYFPGDPEIDALKAALEKDDLLDIQRIKIEFALGKAHDAIGAFETAYTYFRDANAEMASRRPYDEAHNKKRMEAIRAAFETTPVRAASPPPEGEHVPIFIVGPSRSGKTLIESLLTRRADTFRAGERRDMVQSEAEIAHKHTLDRKFPEYLPLLDAGMLSEIGTRYYAKVAALEPDAKSSVNTLPGHYAHVGVIVESLPRAKVIFCRRDAMDCCMRIFFHFYRSRNEHTYEQETVARYFARYWELLDFWKARYGDRILEVRYEDLVSEPAKTVGAIFDYCGLDGAPTTGELDFSTGEIGHWRNYEEQLQPMLKMLRKVASQAAPQK